MDRGDLWVGDAMSGKGDKRRPMTVQYDLFESNWDRIFRRKQIEEQWTFRGQGQDATGSHI